MCGDENVDCVWQDEIGRHRREKEAVTRDKEAAVEQGKDAVRKVPLHMLLQWGNTDAGVEVPSSMTTELSELLSLKPGSGLKIAWHGSALPGIEPSYTLPSQCIQFNFLFQILFKREVR